MYLPQAKLLKQEQGIFLTIDLLTYEAGQIRVMSYLGAAIRRTTNPFIDLYDHKDDNACTETDCQISKAERFGHEDSLQEGYVDQGHL